MNIERTFVTREVKKQINQMWFDTPTQLLIQGQWWSKRSTQRLQTAQCLERGVLTIKQSGHNYIGSISYNNSKKFIFEYGLI